MNILPRDRSDIDQLKAIISREKNAKQRDRLRAVLLALEGQDAPQIARALGRGGLRNAGPTPTATAASPR